MQIGIQAQTRRAKNKTLKTKVKRKTPKKKAKAKKKKPTLKKPSGAAKNAGGRTRSTASVQKRIEEARQLIMKGTVTREIQNIMKRHKVADRQIGKYIAAAKDLIAEDFAEQRPKMLEESLSRRDEIYNLAKKDKKYQVSLNADIDKAKLGGLYPDTGLDVNPGEDEVSLVFRVKGGKK